MCNAMKTMLDKGYTMHVLSQEGRTFVLTEVGIGFVCITTKMTAKDAEKITGFIGHLDKKRKTDAN